MTPKTVRPEEATLTDIEVKEIAIAPALNGTSNANDEDWLSKNPEARALIEKGLADIAAGRVQRMSFAEYVDLDVKD